MLVLLPQAEADLQLVAPLLTSFIVASKKKNHGHHRAEGNVHLGATSASRFALLLSWLHVHLGL